MKLKSVHISLLILITTVLYGQGKIEWDGVYRLMLSDFQSPSTQIGGVKTYSLFTATGVDFAYNMTNFEFMATKNFNSKVGCSFNRIGATIVAPDSTTALSLLNFAQFQFDLSELYARKLRKRIFEEKRTFSDPAFFKPIYDGIEAELTARLATAGKITDLGKEANMLRQLHDEVLSEIKILQDFCKVCKPLKKK